MKLWILGKELEGRLKAIFERPDQVFAKKGDYDSVYAIEINSGELELVKAGKKQFIIKSKSPRLTPEKPIGPPLIPLKNIVINKELPEEKTATIPVVKRKVKRK